MTCLIVANHRDLSYGADWLRVIPSPNAQGLRIKIPPLFLVDGSTC
jgi:hypothetical protein